MTAALGTPPRRRRCVPCHFRTTPPGTCAPALTAYSRRWGRTTTASSRWRPARGPWPASRSPPPPPSMASARFSFTSMSSPCGARGGRATSSVQTLHNPRNAQYVRTASSKRPCLFSRRTSSTLVPQSTTDVLFHQPLPISTSFLIFSEPPTLSFTYAALSP